MKKLFDESNIADICRRYNIRELSVFGSTARGDNTPESDVDILLEFKEGAIIGFKIFALEQELSKVLGGKKVEIINKKYLNPRLRKFVLGDAQIQYAEG